MWLNTSVGAGLPNVTGEWSSSRPTELFNCASNKHSGCSTCSTTKNTTTSQTASGAHKTQQMGIDLSLANPCYGSSNTVTPKSLKAVFIIKY